MNFLKCPIEKPRTFHSRFLHRSPPVIFSFLGPKHLRSEKLPQKNPPRDLGAHRRYAPSSNSSRGAGLAEYVILLVLVLLTAYAAIDHLGNVIGNRAADTAAVFQGSNNSNGSGAGNAGSGSGQK